MLTFKKTTLSNGLRVIVHEDYSTPLVAVNLVYGVGSRNENPTETGLAHLFEHLMFSGTKEIPEFDKPLQLAGGENNAFTSSDLTDYYEIVPAENIEVALWLEADRMNAIDLSKENIDIQKHVVIEEFKQRYLNRPYGDAMAELYKLAYNEHPYRWLTIGAEIAHIENVSEKSINNFYYTHYAPNNAILVLAGNVSYTKGFELAEKWFGTIAARDIVNEELPIEHRQVISRQKRIEKDVPIAILFKAWHIPKRNSREFVVFDMITDILSGGDSGHISNILVRDKKLFSEADIYVSGEIDPGLVIFKGDVLPEVDIYEAEKAVNEIIDNMGKQLVAAVDIEKVKNRHEANATFNNTGILSKAMNLAYYEFLGNAELFNSEQLVYSQITDIEIRDMCNKFLIPSNCSTIYYLPKSN